MISMSDCIFSKALKKLKKVSNADFDVQTAADDGAEAARAQAHATRLSLVVRFSVPVPFVSFCVCGSCLELHVTVCYFCDFFVSDFSA